MPRAKRETALYRRGAYRLDWHVNPDGSRRPFLTVFWYDPERRRVRRASTGTGDLQEAKRWLDAFYLERTTGHATCYACGQALHGHSGLLVADALVNYQLLHADRLPSSDAIRARLAHVVDYMDTLPDPNVGVDQVDERWISGFRQWAERQPIVSPKGTPRARSLGTIENSVIQLAAAIRFAQRRGDTLHGPAFRSQPTKELNRTPQHRSDVAELAAMFRYCVAPQADSAEQRTRLVRDRAALHRFLIISVATLARPDAAHDASTEPKRRQWNGKKRVLNLNPVGRRQTKKYRATVPIAWQVAHLLDAAPPGFFVGPKSIRKAWQGMAAELELPGEGEAGMKLIRRSLADMLRERLPAEAWPELEIFLGHARFDSVSSLYAPFRPDYLRRALAEIEAVIDELETAAPGAFRATCTPQGGAVIPIHGRKNG